MPQVQADTAQTASLNIRSNSIKISRHNIPATVTIVQIQHLQQNAADSQKQGITRQLKLPYFPNKCARPTATAISYHLLGGGMEKQISAVSWSDGITV